MNICRRSTLIVAAFTILLSLTGRLHAQQQVASVEQLKTEAFKALRGGQFDRTSELLSKAASMSPQDSQLSQMATWITQFEQQRQTFAVERRKQYDKAVANVHKLTEAGYASHAIDEAARAYGLADDKTFHDEKWVLDLIASTTNMAEDFDQGEQWLKSLRLYSDLGSIEPANPMWKDKLKLATRRVRLLALYTPDQLKSIQESEIKKRDAVDKLLKVDDEPTTKPTTKPSEDLNNEAFRIDWKETLRGIKFDMLWDSLVDARNNYYRDINYKNLMIGGLTGIKAILTTKGLEGAFPKLADAAARDRFLKVVDDYLAQANAATDANDQMLLRAALAKINSENRETVDLPEEVLVSEFADGAFAELDPFTSMIWPADLDEFNKTTQGEFSGVGIQIQSDADGSLKVVSPLEDSPAYTAGIKAGDIITHINGKNAKGITLNQAVKNITGPSGTTVMLTVRSMGGNVKEYTIERRTIKVASIKGWLHKPGGGWEYLVDPNQKIGYVRLTNFTKTTSDELDQAVAEMKREGAKAMILDLRYNPGGLLTAATEVSDRFLRDGTIVSTRADRDTPNQPTETKAKLDDSEFDLPTVVLVNQYSASASEIVSGGFKDQQRALVVGVRTFGKGSVQMLFPVSSDTRPRAAYLKLTTSHYYLPSGRCIHREENSEEWGVDPDLTIEMTPKQMEAAIDARQELDVLRDINSPPAEGEQQKLEDVAPAVREQVVSGEKKDLLSSDPQLSAALLLLRLQLAGAQL